MVDPRVSDSLPIFSSSTTPSSTSSKYYHCYNMVATIFCYNNITIIPAAIVLLLQHCCYSNFATCIIFSWLLFFFDPMRSNLWFVKNWSNFTKMQSCKLSIRSWILALVDPRGSSCEVYVSRPWEGRKIKDIIDYCSLKS